MKNYLTQASKDYYRIEKALSFLEENFQDQPSLEEIAKVSGLSEYHFQRVFQRWAGISPKRFLQFLTKEYAKQLLTTSSLLEASYDAGLSGPGRLHDLFIHCEAMSPGEYKEKGKGLMIEYGFHPSPFGDCFLAVTNRGICSLLFCNKSDRKNVLEAFRKEWENAQFNHNQKITKTFVEDIFLPKRSKTKNHPLKLFCRGTNFQIKVWEALLKIKPGSVATYKMLAQSIDSPLASRAVGNAVGSNPIAYLIPCHRVIRGMGYLGGYRWGVSRKRSMLAKEASVKESSSIAVEKE